MKFLNFFLFFSLCILLTQQGRGQTLVNIFEERLPRGQNPIPDQDNFTIRNLNTPVYEKPGTVWVRLSENKIKFEHAGTYMIYATAPAVYVNHHRLHLKSSEGVIKISGTSEHASYNDRASSTALLIGIINPTQGAEYYLEHYTQTVLPIGDGPRPSLGIEAANPATIDPEIYTQLLIYKL